MVEFAGIEFRGLTLEDVFRERSKFTHVVTVNAEYIVWANENERLRRIVNNSIATFDGQVPYALACWKIGGDSFSKISGSELVYHICERALLRKEGVFLLGGMKESNARSIEVLRNKYTGLSIEGFSPPFSDYPFSRQHNGTILKCLRNAQPRYLLVGFGAIKQDYWIEDNQDELQEIGIKLAVGVGGTFEMVSGKLKRAPRLIQKMGLEGVYRLANEPKLFRLKRLIVSARFLRYL